MTDDSNTPPAGRPIRDVTIGPDGVTRRGTFQSPASEPAGGTVPGAGPSASTLDEDQLTGPVETVHPPKSAGAHTGGTGPVGPATPPPVASTSHANVETAEPRETEGVPAAVPAASHESDRTTSSTDPTRGAHSTPSTDSPDSRAGRSETDSAPSAAAAAPVAAPATGAVTPPPPLDEAEKQAPAGTVPVAVAGATGEVPRTIFVEAPAAPKKKGNRGVGILISLLATLVFAIVWAGVSAAVIAVIVPGAEFADSYSGFIVNPAAWVPIIAFFVGLVIVVSILNRAGWAWYIVGGLLVGLLAYAGYLAGALISVVGEVSPAEVRDFVLRAALNPLAIAVGITAREVSIWTGAAISARGRRVKARNIEAREQFERESAKRRAEYERVRAGFAA